MSLYRRLACLSGGVTDRARASELPPLGPSRYPGAQNNALKSVQRLQCAGINEPQDAPSYVITGLSMSHCRLLDAHLRSVAETLA